MRNTKPIKKVCIVAHEGKAEAKLFSYLKITLKCKKSFRLESLKGFSSLVSFKKKYDPVIKRSYLKLESGQCSFVFLYDNDLKESAEIAEYIESQKHLSIQLNPNTEGFLLDLLGKTIPFKVNNELTRAKCKKHFFKELGLEAHQLKEKDWEKIFGVNGCKIHELTLKNQTLKSVVELFES